MKKTFEYLTLFSNQSHSSERLNEGGWHLIYKDLGKFGNIVYYLRRQLINR